MPHKFRLLTRAFFYAAAAVYPALVFYFLVIRKTGIRTLSLFVIAFALTAFVLATSKKSHSPLSLFWNSLLLLGLGILCLATDSGIILKFYPLLMNSLFFAAFGITLFRPPSMIYRFAVIQDRSIPNSLNEKRIAAYCLKVTAVWVGFFFSTGVLPRSLFFQVLTLCGLSITAVFRIC
jgi:uncharacterized membrane protein